MTTLDILLNDLKNGNYKSCIEYSKELNELAIDILKYDLLDTNQVYTLGQLIRICNILYNDTDLNPLPIDDGVYDLILEKYKLYNPDFQVGADIIEFKESNIGNEYTQKNYNAIEFINNDNEMIYSYELLYPDLHIDINNLKKPALYFNNNNISKRKHDTKHEHPDLVGTLDKAKFVLCKEAENRGVINDSNVKILERDFFADHIKQGIITENEIFEVVMELKYDGVSVEADCSNIVESARTRGDTGIGSAADITPILEGYPFPHAIPGTDTVGIKFEAIMTQYDLVKFNKAKNKDYKNCRTAIVGLFGSSDAHLYRDYITLIPLQTDQKESGFTDRVDEIEFLNKYFSSNGNPLRYAVATGDYKSILYQIHLFQQEAEYARYFLPFMYDGIVISYRDNNKRIKLGRKNSINKYSMAVKFNPLKRLTRFRGYKFTIGQDGCITPMIYYDPVEFYGTIHPKSSGHSYKRFMELNLRPGDIIEVEYVNDVMPYVYKPNNTENDNNINPVVPFIDVCPECGSKIEISESGKSAYCKNTACKGRTKARMTNMFSKLNLSDFGEAAVEMLNLYHLKDILNLTKDELMKMGFGPIESDNFIDRMDIIKTNNIYDYQIIGALGFNNVAEKTWKLLLNKYSISDILNMYTIGTLKNSIVQIKGIGPITAETIETEMDYFFEDIVTIMNLNNIISTKGMKSGKQIRFTGLRNKELSNQLNALGHDADDNASVTNSTDILIIPYEGYSSGNKIKKASKVPNIQIISIDEFVSNMDRYLS